MRHGNMILSQKLLILMTITVCSFSSTGNASSNTTPTTQATFSKLIPHQGVLHIELIEISNKETWEDGGQKLQIDTSETDKPVTIVLPISHNKRYALRAFQDLNGNAKLDETEKGTPNEPVGFSGNPSLISGLPDLEDCAFGANDLDTIKMRYKKR